MNSWKKNKSTTWKPDMQVRQPMPWTLAHLFRVMQGAVNKRLQKAGEWSSPAQPVLTPISARQWRIWTSEFVAQAERLGGCSDAETYDALLEWIDNFLEAVNRLVETEVVGLQQEYLADIKNLLDEAIHLDWMGDLVDPEGYY